MEDVLEKFKERLKCAICWESYKDPKLLQCFHIYCKECLVRCVVQDHPGSLSLSCPVCRQKTPITSSVSELKSDFRTKEFLGILDDLKKSGDPARLKDLDKQTIVSLAKKKEKIAIYCRAHPKQELVLFCASCEKLVCYQCISPGEKHHLDNYNLLHSSFDAYKMEVMPYLYPMEKQLRSTDEALKQLETCRRTLCDRQLQLKDDIHNTFEDLRRTLHSREAELVRELDQVMEDKFEDITNQTSRLKTMVAQLESCLTFVRESLETNSQGEVLQMKANIMRQAKELSGAMDPELWEPCANDNVMFSVSQDVSNLCRDLGAVCVTANPSKCRICDGGVSEKPKVGRKFTTLVQVTGIKRKSDHEQLTASMECELVSEITGEKVKAEISSRVEDRYEVSCRPVVKGKHRLSITYKGEHIAGSPLAVSVSSSSSESAAQYSPTVIHRGLEQPHGIAINSQNELIVSEFANHCVSIFNFEGKVRSFGRRGFDAGCFQFPRGVAVDDRDNIIVVDSINHRVQKFTGEGKFVTMVGSSGNRPLQFKYPTDVAFNVANNRLYVVDDNKRVQILNSNLNFVCTFGTSGKGRGQFNTPWGIACDSNGRVYVADLSTEQIQIFTPNGEFLRLFCRRMREEVSLSVHSDDLVYVSEKAGDQVSIYNSEGLLVGTLGSNGNGVGKLNSPMGVAVDGSGVVHVCDCKNGRIQVFI